MKRHLDPFDELREHLEDASDRIRSEAALTPGRGPKEGKRWRPHRRAGLFALAALLATGTAIAATTPWNPDVGGDYGQKPPTKVSGGVLASQAAALGVLRREPTDADRGPIVRQALRRLGTSLGDGVRVDGVRLLRSAADETTILVPLKHVGAPDGGIRDGLCIFSANLNAGADGTEGRPGSVSAPVEVSGASCGTLDDVKLGRVANTTSGLVPDGVSRVRVVLASGRTVTADVSNNFYAFELGVSPTANADIRADETFRQLNERRVEWLDSDGVEVPKAVR